VRRSRVVPMIWSSRFFMQAAASNTPASNCLVYRPLCCKLPPSSNPKNKILTDWGEDSNDCLSVTVQNQTRVQTNVSQWSIMSSPNIYWSFLHNSPIQVINPHETTLFWSGISRLVHCVMVLFVFITVLAPSLLNCITSVVFVDNQGPEPRLRLHCSH
jgi:hypothetical protein